MSYSITAEAKQNKNQWMLRTRDKEGGCFIYSAEFAIGAIK